MIGLRRTAAVAAVLLLLAPWLVALPLASDLLLAEPHLSFAGSFAAALGRSLLLATVSAAISVIVGGIAAWSWRGLRGPAWEGALAICLVPVLLGPLALGFVAKIAVLRIPAVAGLIGSREQMTTMTFVLFLCLMQYLPLSAYVIWLHLGRIPRNRVDAATLAGLSSGEFFGDIVWPHLKSLCQVLFALVFLLCSTEYATTELAIHPSVGTETALASHWLLEQYRIWVPASPRIAFAELGAYGFVAAMTFGWFALLLVSLGSHAGDWLARHGGRFATISVRCELPRPTLMARSLAIAFIVLPVTPFAVSYVLFPPRVAESSGGLPSALLWSLPAAVLSTFSAIPLGFLIRWASRRARLLGMSELYLYLLALASLALPAVVVSVATYRWTLNDRSGSVLLLLPGWLGGHVLVSLPLLVSFCIWLHTRVSDDELDYQWFAGVWPGAQLRVSFFDRLRPEYLLVLLFAWSRAWNDGVINRAVTSEIPSLYATVSRQLGVRPDFRAAQFSLSFSVTAAIMMLLAWQRASARAGR